MYISAQGIKTGASAAETGQFELLPVLIAPVARHWRAARGAAPGCRHPVTREG